MTVAINPKLKGKSRTKAIRTQQRRILKECLKGLGDQLLSKINNLPEEWDGFELRWLVVAAAEQHSRNRLHDPSDRRRFRNFKSDCAVRNLP